MAKIERTHIRPSVGEAIGRAIRTPMRCLWGCQLVQQC